MTFRYHLADLAAQNSNYPFHGNVMGLTSSLHPIVELFPKWEIDNWDNKWCAAFVYYCCIEAGYKIPVKHPNEAIKCNFAGCSAWETWAKLKENNFYHEMGEGEFEPAIGDIILYDNVFMNQEHDHIGIIVDVDNGYLRVAEGNVGNISAIVKRSINTNVRGFIRLPDSMNVRYSE